MFTPKTCPGGVTGGELVEPVPGGDHGLSPSLLVARTCTWYDVFAERLGMVVVSPFTFCGPLVKLPLVPWRYCRS